MALSEEKIAELRDVACKIAPLHRSAARPFARAIESEVRKQDTELIRQLMEALEQSHATLWEEDDDPERPAHAAIAAARARMSPPPTA